MSVGPKNRDSADRTASCVCESQWVLGLCCSIWQLWLEAQGLGHSSHTMKENEPPCIYQYQMVMGAACKDAVNYTFVLVLNVSVLTRISMQDDKKECIYAP